MAEIIADNFASRILLVAPSRVVALNVFHMDWHMPISMRGQLRIVNDPQVVMGIRPVPGYGGDTLWLGPGVKTARFKLRYLDEVNDYCRAMGFWVRPYTEFKTYA